jgi:hypothetical protein
MLQVDEFTPRFNPPRPIAKAFRTNNFPGKYGSGALSVQLDGFEMLELSPNRLMLCTHHYPSRGSWMTDGADLTEKVVVL